MIKKIKKKTKPQTNFLRRDSSRVLFSFFNTSFTLSSLLVSTMLFYLSMSSFLHIICIELDNSDPDANSKSLFLLVQYFQQG